MSSSITADQLLSFAPLGIAATDSEGIVTFWNRGAEQLFGWPAGEVRGRHLWSFVAPDLDRGEFELNVLRVRQHSGGRILQFRRCSGSSFPARIRVAAVHDDSGALIGYVGVAVDVTSELEAQSTAELERRRSVALALDASDAALIIDDAGTIRHASAAGESLLGYRPDELVGLPASIFVHPDDFPPGRKQAYEGIVVNVKDVTDRRTDEFGRIRIEQLLRRQSLEDPLTGLPNRTLLADRLERAVARVHRTHSTIGVMFLDLDRFKVVNDGLGHDAGDELLRMLAQRISDVVSDDDTVARFGSDEFVVVVERGEDEAEVTAVAESLLEAVSRPMELKGHDIVASASIGIALAKPGDERATAVSLIQDADVAMYRVKAQGGAAYRLFDESMGVAARGRLVLEADLRRAIENGELRVHYQPVVTFAGVVDGVEALVRWEHPSRGLIPPSEFVPLAEETGLVVDLGSFVLREAVRQVARWRRELAPDLRLAVNVSGRELTSHLARLVRDVLDEEGLAAAALSLEITETALTADPVGAASVLSSIRRLGVRVGVDDFGTGYSSLLQLRQFAVDILKLDRVFVAGLGVHGEDSVIIGSVIELAHALGLEAVAEGVETESQASELAALGCDLAQGYLWSRPLLVEGFESLLSGPRLPSFGA